MNDLRCNKFNKSIDVDLIISSFRKIIQDKFH